MSLPADLQRLADELAATERAAQALANRVTDEEFFWQPDGGRWSIAHCLMHLATSATVYGGAVRQGIEKARQHGWTARGPARPGFFGRLFVAHLEPPATRKSKAPAKIQPTVVGTREEVLRAYRAGHEEYRQLLADAAGIDTNRATFQNPFVRVARVRVSTGLHVIAAHERRHVWQAEQVEKALRDPLTARRPDSAAATPR